MTDGIFKKLAESFAIDIVYYNGSKLEEFKNDNRIIGYPLAILRNNDNVGILYTRGQARLFADDDSTKKLFSKDVVKTSEETKDITSTDTTHASEPKKAKSDDTIKEQEKEKEREKEKREKEEQIKKLEEEKVSMSGQLKEMKPYKEIAKLFSSVLEDFANKVFDLFEGITACSLNSDSKNCKKACEKLGEAELINSSFESNKSLKTFYPDFFNKLATWRSKWEKKQVSKALEKLCTEAGANKASEEHEKCYKCEKKCNPGTFIKLNCKHILDVNCLNE